jgi:hypothetical protein
MGRQTKLKIDPATLRRLRLAFLLFTVFIGSIGTILVIIQDKPFDRAIWFGTIIALAPWVYYFLNRLFWRNEVYAMWLAVIHSPLYMTPPFFRTDSPKIPSWQPCSSCSARCSSFASAFLTWRYPAGSPGHTHLPTRRSTLQKLP